MKQHDFSLYIHIPWCIKKCPYCDFNSYQKTSELPEADYIERLFEDLARDLPWVQGKTLSSIFFGGGTPSLFSPKSFESILSHVLDKIPHRNNIEITMEANPGTLEHKSFKDYRAAGINRISIGAQSFDNGQLNKLGRIHNADNIYKIDHFKLPNTQTVSVSTIKLPRATLSASIGQEIQPSKLYCPTSQTLLSNERALLKLEQNNSTIAKQMRSVVRNHKNTLRISHKFLSSAKASNNSAVRIIKINSSKLPSIMSNGPPIETDI